MKSSVKGKPGSDVAAFSDNVKLEISAVNKRALHDAFKIRLFLS